jgi:RND family efflux transporter MFP subunit
MLVGAVQIPGPAFGQSQAPAVDCVLAPSQVVDLSSPVAGVIEQITVERSDEVVSGQVVAQLEARVERATVALARARTEVDPQLETERINVQYDERRQERVESLYDRNVIPINDVEDAARNAELSRWRLEQVRDLQDIRRLELARAEELLEQKTVRATIDGFVVERFKSVGEYVEDQAIVRIADMDPLRVEAILPVRFFGVIRPGMRAEVQPETLGGLPRSARVTVVDRMADAASGTFAVTLEMDNPGNAVPAGLKCEVRFTEATSPALGAAPAIDAPTEAPRLADAAPRQRRTDG